VRRIGRARLADLAGASNDHVAGLGELQRRLDQHYRR
jgi:hypothetical protein